MPKEYQTWQESFIPGILRCTASLVTHPIEQVKVRLQIQTGTRIKIWQIPSWIVHDYKLLGKQNSISYFYKGYPATLFSLCAKTVYKYPLLIHGPKLIEQGVDHLFSGLARIENQHNKTKAHPILYQIALAPFLITVDTLMQAPQRRIKYITMTNSLGHKSSTLDTIRFLVQGRKEGMGFWYGSRAYSIKHGIGQASMLFTDALIRETFLRYSKDDSSLETSEHYVRNSYYHINTYLSSSLQQQMALGPNMHNPLYIAALGLNGVLLTVFTNPLDVVLTRIGSKIEKDHNTGFFKTLITIGKTEGWLSLFRGTSLRILPRTVTVVYTSLAISWGRGF